MRPRTLVALIAVTFVGAALALERHALPESSLVARAASFELTHLVAHSILYGGLAAALARWWFPDEALAAPRVERARRAVLAAACFALVAVAQECAQALSRGRAPGREELFDLAVDLSAAALGVAAWSRAGRGRRWQVARSLGLVLHPLVLGPAGVFAVTWAATRDGARALACTAVATAAVLPVAALWLAGLRRGWFSDRDLSQRAERPPLLVAALVTALSFAAAVHLAAVPASLRAVATAGLVATALVTAATLAGLKVSGHAAVPVGVLALLAPVSQRGLWPFALAALAVSWARVAEGRHTRAEVLAAWGIAGASGLVAAR